MIIFLLKISRFWLAGALKLFRLLSGIFLLHILFECSVKPHVWQRLLPVLSHDEGRLRIDHCGAIRQTLFMPLKIAAMRRAVQAMHGCTAEHLQSTLVQEVQDGHTLWAGQVEIFRLSGHPDADRAYVWVQRGEGEERYVSVLNLPPISSAREAVQTILVKTAQGGSLTWALLPMRIEGGTWLHAGGDV
jgi:hypothetical protein